jgi:hypothetical protein
LQFDSGSSTLLAATAIAIVNVVEATLPFASVTKTVIAEEPAVVGVPEIAPVAESRVNPAGKVPLLIPKVNGSAPPVTVTARENAVPVVPESPEVGADMTGLSVILSVVAEVPTAVPPVFVPVALYLM